MGKNGLTTTPDQTTKKKNTNNTITTPPPRHTHTHTQREIDRERERDNIPLIGATTTLPAAKPSRYVVSPSVATGRLDTANSSMTPGMVAVYEVE
jgi:hypothetical protein